MKQRKLLYAAVAATALLFTLLACSSEHKEPAAVENQPNVPSIAKATQIVYSDGSTTLRFAMKDAETHKWLWTDDETFPLDSTYLNDLTEQLRTLRKAAPVTVAEDLSTYGLADTVRYLSVADGEETIQYLFGAAAQEGGRYFMIDGDETGSIYLAPQALIDALSRSIYDMALLPALPTLTEESMRLLTLTCGDSRYLTVHTDNGWKSGGKLLASFAPALWEDTAVWTLARCVDYGPAPGAAALCGLDTGLNAEFSYKNSVGTDSVLTLRIGNETETGRYVTVGEDPTIYAMDSAYLDALLALSGNVM